MRTLAAPMAVALLLAVLLVPWVPEPSERFWLLLPLVLGPWVAMRSGPAHRRTLALAAGVLLVGGSLVSCALQVGVLGSATGHWVPLAADPFEALVNAWYLLSLLLLAGTTWWEIRTAIRGWHVRRGSQPDGLAPQVLPIVIASPLVVPVLLGSTLAHRTHVPDGVLPDRTYEDVVIRTSDGRDLSGWWIPAGTPSSRTVLLGHGIGANRSLTLSALVVADRLDANALMFDLRGHGESAGHTTSFGCHEQRDVLAAAAWIREEHADDAQQLVAVGLSLSTAPVVLAAAEIEPPFDAVILDSPFTAPVEMTDGVLRWIPSSLRPLLVWPGVPLVSLETRCWLPAVRPVDRIADVRAPIWIAHTDGDPLIPVEQGRRMAAAAREPKGWFEAHGNRHMACGTDTEGWLREAGRFLDEHLAPAPTRPD
ncbi:MAG: alpha/beta hydrolase [Alphaproteobacteria bacterium]|nr:alpha/beta hydrolase [Alphaproteobacteria bacterium]MCB9696767.1 alpha/beta hydrolase [Alphaproteobacteria bacterium]